MRYITSILPIMPVAILITAVVYACIYMLLKKKRPKPSKAGMLAEFVLLGWLVMFIYVTQVMSFGNGLGDRMNLVPLRQFVIAFRYGSNNAGGVWQFLLNIIMFVPLGLLLPVVFKKMRSWRAVFAVSFALSLATELLQLISYRGTDIDDVIANTLGGLCGFALYVLIVGLAHILCQRRQRSPENPKTKEAHETQEGPGNQEVHENLESLESSEAHENPNGHESPENPKDITIPKYRSKLITAVVLLALVTGSFVALKFCDGSSKYGNLYYGHLIPSEVEIKATLDDTQTKRAVYKYKEQISLSDLEAKLQALTGFEGDWVENRSDETYYSLIDDGKAIFINSYNTWGVYYEYGETKETTSPEIDKTLALQKAWSYLESFGIKGTDVEYAPENTSEYGDDNYYFDFTAISDASSEFAKDDAKTDANDDTNENAKTRAYGDVLLALGKDGRLISITDNRIWCEYVEDVQCISMSESIEVAQDVGCGDWQGKAVVESVEPSYSFISETGYLIPTWMIKGYLTSSSQTLQWRPQIDAIK